MKIFFVNGLREGEELEFILPEITIGREEDNTLRVPTEGISRYHAVFRQCDGSWKICDLGSTNGTKVNRVRIEGEKILKEGDLLEFGDQMLRVTELDVKGSPVIFSSVRDTLPIADVRGTAALNAHPLGPTGSGKTRTLSESAPPPPPAAVPPPTPKPSGPTAAAADFTIDGATLFDGAAAPSGKRTAPNPADGGGKRRFSNMFYYVIIACVAVMGISLALILLKPAEEPVGADGATPTPGGKNLSLVYTKTVRSKENVFRFSLVLENGVAEFTIDDIATQRHYTRTENIAEDMASFLASRINSSGIWTEPQQSAPMVQAEETRTLLLSDGSRIKQMTVAGKYPPDAFDAVERAVNDFSENYGLQTFALTPEQLRQQAELNFAKAEDLYGNREAMGTNLRDAIKRYRLVVGALEQFSPHPPMWDRARKQLEEAEQLRRRKLDALEVERVRLQQMENFNDLRRVFREVMDLADQDSREYLIARDRLFKLDTLLRRKRR